MFHQSSTMSVQQQIQNCREDLNRINLIASQLQQSEQQNAALLQQLQQVEANTSQQLSRLQQAERNAVQQLQQLQQICQEATTHLEYLGGISSQMSAMGISGQQQWGQQQGLGFRQYQ